MLSPQQVSKHESGAGSGGCHNETMGARPVCEGRADGAPPCLSRTHMLIIIFFLKRHKSRTDWVFLLTTTTTNCLAHFGWSSNHLRRVLITWPPPPPSPHLILGGGVQPFCRGFPGGLNRLHRAPDRAPGSRRLAARRASWNTEPSLLPSSIWPEFELNCASAPGPITVMRGLGKRGREKVSWQSLKAFPSAAADTAAYYFPCFSWRALYWDFAVWLPQRAKMARLNPILDHWRMQSFKSCTTKTL